MEEIILHRYLLEEASEKEVQQVFDWMNESEENHKEVILLKQTWALSAVAGEDEEKAWEEVNEQIQGTVQKKNLCFTYFKYVAIAIFLFGIGAISQQLITEKTPEIIYAENTSLTVPVGQISSVILPDGTLVYLNSESRLVYGNDFAKGKRIVELSGEGYFEVQTDIDHPFIVKTPDKVHVKVHGTAFNLRAYEDEQYIHTILEKGSVSIIDNEGNELTKLIPGERATYTKHENRLKITHVKTEFYSSWKDGMITFRNESLGEIARMMERWYNVKIVFADSDLANELYNGTIMKNKPIDQILEVFRVTSLLNYEITPKPNKPTLICWKKQN